MRVLLCYYLKNGKPTGWIVHIKLVIRGLRSHGHTLAADFGPLAFKALRQKNATLPFMGQIPAEWCDFSGILGKTRRGSIIRPCDLEMSGDVWQYHPESHKTEHHGRGRVIVIGPKAAERPPTDLLRDKSAYCLSPQDSERKRREAQHEVRRTPLERGNRIQTHTGGTAVNVKTSETTRRDFLAHCTAAGIIGVMSSHFRSEAAESDPAPDWATMLDDPVTRCSWDRRIWNASWPCSRAQGPPACDPQQIAENIAKLRTIPEVNTGHPLLDLSVKTGLAHIDATFRGDHPKYGVGTYAQEDTTVSRPRNLGRRCLIGMGPVPAPPRCSATGSRRS